MVSGLNRKRKLLSCSPLLTSWLLQIITPRESSPTDAMRSWTGQCCSGRRRWLEILFRDVLQLLKVMPHVALVFCSLYVSNYCRWLRLKAQMIEKRSKLGESQTLQQFSRDVDEIEAWISEKLQTASDESYKDPTNIQVNVVLSLKIRISLFTLQGLLWFENPCSGILVQRWQNSASRWTCSPFNKEKMEVTLCMKGDPK